MQTLDIISINIWNILISLVNLLIIFLILKKLLFKPVKKVLDQRQGQVGKLYDDAKTAKELAEKEKEQYDEKLAMAHDEAVEIVSAAKERAERMGDEIVDEANRKATGMIKRADEEIAQQRKKAMNEIKEDISNISVDIAEKVIEREIDERDHKELIDKFINEIGEDDE